MRDLKTSESSASPRCALRRATAAGAALLLAMHAASCTTLPSSDNGLVGLIGKGGNHSKTTRVSARGRPEPAPATSGAGLETGGVAVAHNRSGPDMPSYRLSPGDVVAVSYFMRPTSETNEEYVVDTDDVLTVSVAAMEKYTADVTVRPDGCISFFLIGELPVRGQTVAQIRAQLLDKVAKAMDAVKHTPEVTVILKKGRGLAAQFLESLNNNLGQGATRVIQVRNDGAITFPLIGERLVMGLTLAELTSEVEAAYDALLRRSIVVTLNMASSADDNIAVLGEVRRPGRYSIANPVTPFFALAMAGGALDTGKAAQAVVVKRREGAAPTWHVVNLDVNSNLPSTAEVALGPQDMLLVPRTGVANLQVFVENYIRRLMPLPGGISVGYSLNK